MRALVHTLVLLFWTCETQALSLLFSREEEAQVLDYLGQMQPNQERLEETGPILSGLLFFSPSNWCLWINGKKCTPNECDPRYQILHVSRQEVRLKSEGGSLILTPRLSQNTFQEVPSQGHLDPVD